MIIKWETALQNPKQQIFYHQVVLLHVSQQRNGLREEEKKIDRDINGRPRRNETFTVIEKNSFDRIRAKIREIKYSLNHSICKCTVCSASDKDMTYNPVDKRWFYVDCYQQLQQDYNGKEESMLFP